MSELSNVTAMCILRTQPKLNETFRKPIHIKVKFTSSAHRQMVTLLSSTAENKRNDKKKNITKERKITPIA